MTSWLSNRVRSVVAFSPATPAIRDRSLGGPLILFVWSISNEMRQWRHLCHAFWRQNHSYSKFWMVIIRDCIRYYIVHLSPPFSSKSNWLIAKTVAYHLGDPGSILGEGNLFINWRQYKCCMSSDIRSPLL